MALWFAEIRCRELMLGSGDGWHSEDNEFLSQRDRENQLVIDIEMALQQGDVSGWDGSLSGWGGLN